ncbi:hypothetical protein LRE75_21770 [Streptomyces sp. 372A]|uniref:hypothetical protein n=1 Tax=Streptomyces sp. SAS_281 TaxID=3412744 RepID=UPI00403CA38D
MHLKQAVTGADPTRSSPPRAAADCRDAAALDAYLTECVGAGRPGVRLPERRARAGVSAR